MKLFAPLLIAVLSATLISGCSKKPAHGKPISSESIIIEPGTSIGSVRSGMTMQQVQGLLGEPNRTMKGILEYQNLGLIVLPAEGGLVGNVMCVDNNGHEPIKPFAGHTKEGIGIGSSRVQVISAYGEPPTIERGRNYESLIYYQTRGMNFVIKNDKVSEMTVFLSRTN